MKLNIKDRIDKLDISKNKLAQQLGISYPTMLDMYNGESTSIKLDTLEKLCNILKCTPNDILVLDSIKMSSNQKTQPTVIHLSDLHFAESDSNNLTETLQRLLDALKVEILNGTDGKQRGYIFLDGFDETNSSWFNTSLKKHPALSPQKKSNDNKDDTD